MSYYETTPVPPRNATVEDVRDQIEQMRRLLEEQMRQAYQAAIEQADERARAILLQQAQAYQDSLEMLDEELRERLEDMDIRHRQQLQQITQRIYDDIGESQKQMEAHFHQQLEHLASDVTDQIQGLGTEIQRQQQEIQIINGQMQAVVQGINDLTNDINKRFAEQQQSLTDIQGDLDSIHQRFQDDDERARETVKTALALWDLVRGRAMLERFVPKEAQNVGLTMQWLTQNNNHGAALTAAADQAINAIRLAEIHAVQEKAKHDAMVEIALTQIEKVLSVVNENREVEREVEGGDPMEVECDFWSEGEYGRLEIELNDLRAELEDRYNNNLTENRIKEILQRSAEIENRILQICAESVAKAVLSEARVETVEDIINAMKKKGWTLKGLKEGHPENNYMGGEEDHDWRKGVYAVLENNLGEEITIIVDPVSDSQNQLIVHQETGKGTDQKVAEQMESIKHDLCDSGYTVGDTAKGVTQIPEMGSGQSLGRAQATDKVREKLHNN